jgi:glycosyltransferase involved in cell wall biosynthesis
MRRYFDEYRGLRDTIGHVERIGFRSTLRDVSANVSRDRAWIARQGINGSEALAWSARSAAHHAGRKVFAALGSRADHLPAPLRSALSLERRDSPARGAAGSLPRFVHIPRARERGLHEEVIMVHRDGEAPLLEVPPGLPERDRLRIAMVLPPFTQGSGGHYLLLQILRRLELRGHVCSVWLHDSYGGWARIRGGELRHRIREYFAPMEGAAYNGFDDWHGADVVLATGWETVHPVLQLPDCHARVYLVNDYEPDFFAASAERVLAADTYEHGLYCLAGSPWLRDLLKRRHGALAEAIDYGVDHDIYRARELRRRDDTVVYYARTSTQRRAVPIGLLALGELYRRRPETRIVLFGGGEYIQTAFPYELAGVLTPDQLARLYAEATVGLCLSLTNFSLMPKEMLACGLPCVELAGVSAESIFGQDGPIELAPLEPIQIAAAMEKLLDDRELWRQRSTEGIDFVATHTWDRATDQVEAGLRHALRIREEGITDHRPRGIPELGVASRSTERW